MHRLAVNAYLTRTPTGVAIIAIAPDSVDLADEPLWWQPRRGTARGHLASMGYRIGKAHPHREFRDVKVYPLRPLAGTALVSAAEAARLCGIAANTLRVYARRGQAPRPLVDGRRPRWLDREILGWAAQRVGQGARTDQIRPILEHV